MNRKFIWQGNTHSAWGNDDNLNGSNANNLKTACIKQTHKWGRSHTSFRGGGGTFSAVSHESKIGRTTAGRKRPEIAHYKVRSNYLAEGKNNGRLLAFPQ